MKVPAHSSSEQQEIRVNEHLLYKILTGSIRVIASFDRSSEWDGKM